MKNKNNFVTVELRLELKGLRDALAQSLEIVLLRNAQKGKLPQESVEVIKDAFIEEMHLYFNEYKTSATDAKE